MASSSGTAQPLRTAALALVLLALSSLVFASCTKHEGDGDAGSADTHQPPSAATQPPTDATVVGFRLTQYGMYLRPFYSIRQVGDEYLCATTSSELYWEALDGADALKRLVPSNDGTYAYQDHIGGDPLGKDARFSLATLSQDDMDDFTQLLAEHGVFAWDGYDEHWEPPEGLEVTDTGETFDLQVLFSDGTRVNAHGVDAHPEGYNEAILAITDFFEAHEDWSRYYPTTMPDSPITSLTIEFLPTFYRPGTSDFKIELWRGRSQWVVLLRDGQGEFVEMGTDIGDYGTVNDASELPFERFASLLRTYDVASWNGRQDSSGGSDERWVVRVSFSNGQSLDIDTTEHPQWYEGFRAAVVREIIGFYGEVRGTAE